MITVTIETENDAKRVIIIEGNTEKAINELSSKPARFLQSKILIMLGIITAPYE